MNTLILRALFILLIAGIFSPTANSAGPGGSTPLPPGPPSAQLLPNSVIIQVGWNFNSPASHIKVLEYKNNSMVGSLTYPMGELNVEYTNRSPGSYYQFKIQACNPISNCSASSAFSARVDVLQTVAKPSISPNGGTYDISRQVALTPGTTGSTIYYTTNNTTPTTSSSVYSSPFTLTSSKTVKAIGVKSGMTSSGVASARFTIKPQADAPTINPSTRTGQTSYSVSFFL